MAAAAGTNPLSDFPWPVLPGGEIRPIWSGAGFEVAGERLHVLPYASEESAWTDDLTLIHETEGGGGRHPIDRASRALALRSVRSVASDSKRVILEVGCSSGFFLRDLKAAHPGAAAIGADYLPGPLLRLAALLPSVPLLQFDLRSSPLPDGCVDALVCLNVLEHIDDDEKALSEISRMLRPGGFAHIEVPAAPSAYDIYDEFLMHQRRYSMGELTRKSEQAGLEVASRTHLGALVFPFFYAAKRWGKRQFKLSQAQKEERVRNAMRKTQGNGFLRAAMGLELVAGRLLRYPFGIRCVVVLRRQTTSLTGVEQ